MKRTNFSKFFQSQKKFASILRTETNTAYHQRIFEIQPINLQMKMMWNWDIEIALDFQAFFCKTLLFWKKNFLRETAANPGQNLFKWIIM
jgi:hypothetical protein